VAIIGIGDRRHWKAGGPGEVRVKARLPNAVDESLVRQGMLRPE
jgi:hypothetical protein